MNFVLLNDFNIQCNNCGKIIRVDKDSLEVDYDSYERQMGNEIQYRFYGEIDCCCSQKLNYEITAIEYPIGAYNTECFYSYGCSFISQPDIIFETVPDFVLSIYEQILSKPEKLFSLEPREFENFVADIFKHYGFDVKVTKKTRDGGKDIVAVFEMGGIRYTTYFECKLYSLNCPVGVNVVRNLFAVMEIDGIDKGVIVTTSRFTSDAIKEAKKLNGRIQLVDYYKLCSLLNNQYSNNLVE